MSDKLIFDSTTNPDDFRVVRLVGCGGFGQVIELIHIPTNTHLAGKLLRKSKINKQSIQEIKNEVSIMKTIRCDNIVNFYGTILYPKENPHNIIVMDYCDRGSIRDILDYTQSTLNEDQISIIMHDVLEALSVLHNKYRIIHGDIKAANILMSSDYSVKITDFGLSRKFVGPDSQSFAIFGTSYWMAPEVILAENYSFPVDIWSVGATAVELIEGAPPYFQFPPSRAMKEIISQGFPGFRSNTKVSYEFNDFVRLCFKIRPSQRPSAEKLLEHPFIKRANSLDRKTVFKELLSNEIDFNDLVESSDIEDLQKFIHFDNPPKFNQKTNKYNSKVSVNSFVSKAGSDIKVNSLYRS